MSKSYFNMNAWVKKKDTITLNISFEDASLSDILEGLQYCYDEMEKHGSPEKTPMTWKVGGVLRPDRDLFFDLTYPRGEGVG